MTTMSSEQYRRMMKKKKGSNPKVRGATIIRKHNKLFRSKLELHLYEKLVLHNIKFIWQPKFKVLDKFKYRGETVQSIFVTPDAWLKQYNIIAEPKGYPDEKWPLRLKLLKRALYSTGHEPDIRLLQRKKDIDNFILEILSMPKINEL